MADTLSPANGNISNTRVFYVCCSGFGLVCFPPPPPTWLTVIGKNSLKVSHSWSVIALSVYTLEYICHTDTKHLVSVAKYIIFSLHVETNVQLSYYCARHASWIWKFPLRIKWVHDCWFKIYMFLCVVWNIILHLFTICEKLGADSQEL